MDLVIYLGGAVLFFALVMASIGLHEIGHLVPGKLFDVKTTQYFVGFGRTLWSRTRGETEYGIKAIPLGGYVRFVGMFPPPEDRPGQVRAGRTGLFQSMADNARAAEYVDILPEDEGRLGFLQILDVVAAVLDEHVDPAAASPADVGSSLVEESGLTVDVVLAADRWARGRARVLASTSGEH